MSNTSELVDAAVPVRREPLSIEEQGAGFHAILAGATGQVLITNDIGRRVLALCDGSHNEDAIAGELAAAHPDVSAERIAGDVHRFLATAVDKGVVEWTR